MRAPDAHLVSTPWSIRAVSNDARVLTIDYSYLEGYAPWRFERVAVSETQRAVTIAVHQRVQSTKRDGWAAFLDIAQATVALDQPLGHRRLRHARLDRTGIPGPRQLEKLVRNGSS